MEVQLGQDDDKVRYLTKELLSSLNERAIIVRAHNHLSRGTVRRLAAEELYPVVNYSRTESHVTIEVGLDPEGNTAFMDIPTQSFDTLPHVICPPGAIEALQACGDGITLH